MKNKVNIEDFLILIYWVRTYYLFESKDFAYQNLLEQAETYALKNTPLDTKIHSIDDLMVDAFKIYSKIKSTEQRVSEILETIKNPLVDKDEMRKETRRYESIVEDLIENYKYDDAEIRGIQKGFLTERMSEYISVEDYENAAKVRDMIKEC